MNTKADVTRRARNVRRRRRAGSLRVIRDEPEAIAATLPDRLLTKRELLVLAGASSSTVRKLLQERLLPEAVNLGPTTLRWWYSEVVAALRRLPRGPGGGNLPRGPRAVK